MQALLALWLSKCSHVAASFKQRNKLYPSSQVSLIPGSQGVDVDSDFIACLCFPIFYSAS